MVGVLNGSPTRGCGTCWCALPSCSVRPWSVVDGLIALSLGWTKSVHNKQEEQRHADFHAANVNSKKVDSKDRKMTVK